MRIVNEGNQHRLSFRLLSDGRICEYDYRSSSAALLQPIVEFFHSLKYLPGHAFAGDSVYTEEVRDKLKALKKSLRGMRDSNVTPKRKGNSLFDFFSELSLGQLFSVSHESIDINCTIHNYIYFLGRVQRKNPRPMDEKFSGHLSRLLLNYSTYCFGMASTVKSIGAETHERQCRFCGCKKPTVHFKHESHAIPEAVGNKLLFCLDECDECNNALGELEKNFTYYMDFRRAMNAITKKGSECPPNLRGMNFGVESGPEGPRVYIDGSKVDPALKERGVVKLIHSMMITDEGLYRALCKFVIDLLPAEEVFHFEGTINWINGLKNITTLPEIRHVYEVENVIQPRLWVFLNHRSLDYSPYCTAMLHVCDTMFLYMIPFVDIDEDRFRNNDGLKQHWAFFESCIPVEWKPWDLSSRESKFPHIFLSLKDCIVEHATSPKDVRKYLADAPVYPSESIHPVPGGAEFHPADIGNDAVLMAPRIEMNNDVFFLSERECERIAIDFNKMDLSVDRSSGNCIMSFDVALRDSVRNTTYVSFSFSCLFAVNRISEYIDFNEKGHYANLYFVETIWENSLLMAEQYFRTQRVGTIYAEWDVTAIGPFQRCANAITFTDLGAIDE